MCALLHAQFRTCAVNTDVSVQTQKLLLHGQSVWTVRMPEFAPFTLYGETVFQPQTYTKRFTHSHTIIHAYTPWHKIHTFPATHTERGAFLQLSPNWSLSLMLCRIRAAAWGFELQLSPAFIVSRGNSHAHPAAHTRSSQLFLYPVLSGASCHTGKP